MSRSGLLAAAVATIALAAAPAVGAAPIRECGNWGDHGDGRMRWGTSDIHGAGIFNVTTRGVSCRVARRFVRRYRGPSTHAPTWRCREHTRHELSDVRCTASQGRVIRWQAGS